MFKAFLDWLFEQYEAWIRQDGVFTVIHLKHKKPLATKIVFLNAKGEVMSTVQPTVLNEGNSILLTAQGQDDNDVNRDLDSTQELAWAASAEGIAAISPIAGTRTANVTYVAPGTVDITATGDADLTSAVKNVSGKITIQTVAKPIPQATKIAITAAAEVPVP